MAGACGSCTACCRVFAIPEVSNKPAGKWCQHCTIGEGCNIYDTRPVMCADFKCMWLLSREREDVREHLADDLRPDRCKVVFSPTTHDQLIAATVMPGSPDAWRKGAPRHLIGTMVKHGFRVVAGLPASIHRTLIDQGGEHEVEMSEPDENGNAMEEVNGIRRLEWRCCQRR